MIEDVIFCAVLGFVVSMIDQRNYPAWVNIGMGLIVALFCFTSITILRWLGTQI